MRVGVGIDVGAGAGAGRLGEGYVASTQAVPQQAWAVAWAATWAVAWAATSHLGSVLQREHEISRGAAEPAQPLDVGDLPIGDLHDVLALEPCEQAARAAG